MTESRPAPYVELDVFVVDRSDDKRAGWEASARPVGAEMSDPQERELTWLRPGDRRTWEEVLDRLRNGRWGGWAEVEGPPGSGKSTLAEATCQRIATRAATEVRPGAGSPQTVELPVLCRARDVVGVATDGPAAAERTRARLAGALTDRYGPRAQAVAAEAHTPRSWVILDGLDEVVADDDVATLDEVLETLASWPCRVVITTRPAGRLLPVPVPEAATLRLAPLTGAQVEDFLLQWESVGAARIRAGLAAGGALADLVANPFLLTAACWVAEHGELPDHPTRTALYTRLVGDLLARRQGRPSDHARRMDWLPALAHIALVAHLEDPGRSSLGYHQLKTQLQSMAADPFPPDPPEPLGVSLLEELARKRLLFPTTPGRQEWAVPHRSIIEYLAGVGLAMRLHRDPESTFALIDELAWLAPSASDAIAFAAGTLDYAPAQAGWEDLSALVDPGLRDRLLHLLADPGADDLFRHRLTVAARALAEARGARPELRDQITTQVWRLWMRHRGGTRDLVRHLDAAIGDVALAGGHVDGTPITDVVLDAIRADGFQSKALTLLGPAAAGPDVVARMPSLDRWESFHDEWDIQRWWVPFEALADIGPAAATAEVVELLVRNFEHPHSTIEAHHNEILNAIHTTGGSGPGSPPERVLAEASEVLARLRPASSGPAVVRRLTDLVASEDHLQSRAACTALEALGEATAPLATAALLVHARENRRDSRYAAVRAIGRINKGRGSPDVAESLSGLLDEDDLQWWSTWAIGQLNPAVVAAPVRSALVSLLGAQDPQVRAVAASSLWSLEGPLTAADRLVDLLDDRAPEVVRTAFRCLADGGPDVVLAATAAFVRLLHRRDLDFRDEIAASLAEERPPGSRAGVLDFLAASIRRDDADRPRAADALARVATAAIQCGEVPIDTLVALAADRDPAIRSVAPVVIKSMSPITKGAAHVVFDVITMLLDDSVGEVRHAAADAFVAVRFAEGPVLEHDLARRLVRQAGALSADPDPTTRALGMTSVGRCVRMMPSGEFARCLVAGMHDPEATVRVAAARAAGNSFGRGDVSPNLHAPVEALLDDAESSVRVTAVTALRRLGVPASTTPRLVRMLYDKETTRDALAALIDIGPPAACREVVLALLHRWNEVDPQRWTWHGPGPDPHDLHRLGPTAHIYAAEALASPDAALRSRAARSLREFDHSLCDDATLVTLTRLLEGEKSFVKASALDALMVLDRTTSGPVPDAVLRLVEGPHYDEHEGRKQVELYFRVRMPAIAATVVGHLRSLVDRLVRGPQQREALSELSEARGSLDAIHRLGSLAAGGWAPHRSTTTLALTAALLAIVDERNGLSCGALVGLCLVGDRRRARARVAELLEDGDQNLRAAAAWTLESWSRRRALSAPRVAAWLACWPEDRAILSGRAAFRDHEVADQMKAGQRYVPDRSGVAVVVIGDRAVRRWTSAAPSAAGKAQTSTAGDSHASAP